MCLQGGEGGDWSEVCDALSSCSDYRALSVDMRCLVVECLVQLLMETPLCKCSECILARCPFPCYSHFRPTSEQERVQLDFSWYCVILAARRRGVSVTQCVGL